MDVFLHEANYLFIYLFTFFILPLISHSVRSILCKYTYTQYNEYTHFHINFRESEQTKQT